MSRIAKRRTSRRQFRTLADQFCDTYLVEHEGEYLVMLPRTERAIVAERLFTNGRTQCLREYEGVTAYKVRGRFVEAVRRAGDNPRALYAELARLFTEEAIMNNFLLPNVWLLRRNDEARRRRMAEISEKNRMRKLDREGYALHRQCVARTANKSASQSAREARGLEN